MAFHEIEIPEGYVIKGDAFFDENKFKYLIDHNNLQFKEKDIVFLEKYLQKTEQFSYIHNRYNFILDSDFETLNNTILNPLKFNDNIENSISIYSTWFLFYIALNKSKKGLNIRNDFLTHLNDFKFMEEYLFKKYCLFFSDRNKDKIEDGNKKLSKSLNLYIKSIYKDKNGLIIFLKFLLKLHKIFFNNEQYKIMWNLESLYIHEIIEILINTFSLKYKEIIEKLDFKMGLEISQIDSIYIELSKYITDNKIYIINKELSSKINHIFNVDLNEKELFSIIYKEEYFEIYNSIIELQKRIYLYNKKDYNLCLAILIGLVLSLEPKIKNLSGIDESKPLLTHLKQSKNFNFIEKDIEAKTPEKGTEYFNAFNLIFKEKESIIKHLLLYREIRNYLAHGKVDFFRLLEKDQIKNIVESIIISIFFLIKKV